MAERRPHGWRCAHCGCKRFFLTRNGQGRQLWERFICGYQSSSIVGTVLAHTHLPQRVWFLAMYLMTQNKNAISAPALERQLGVSYKSAWLLKHKLMQTMAVRGALPPAGACGDRRCAPGRRARGQYQRRAQARQQDWS